MKSKALAAIFLAGTMAILAPRAASAAWSVSISYFQQELSPYGRWVYTAGYGEIWHPTVVAATWEPYLDGEWVYTDCGWTWVSYDPFGQDPFHYGTWVRVDPYGWCWVPGYVWGPAWVTWAYTDIYIGWAPLPPTFALAVSGYAGAPVTVAQNQYVFVPANSFVGTNISTARVAVSQNAAILSNAHRVTRFSVTGGLVRATDPPTSFVERATGKAIHKTTLAAHKLTPAPITAARVGSGKRISITAPKHDRAIAAKEAKPSSPKVAQHTAASSKGAPATAHTSKSTAALKENPTTHAAKPTSHAGTAHKEAVEKHASGHAPPAHGPSNSKHEAKPPAHHEQARPATVAAPPKPAHHQGSSAGQAPRTVEGKHESQPAHVRQEERPIAMNSAPPQHPRQAQPASPAPQAQQPQPGSAPAAAAKPPQRPPQPQGQPPEKKEKHKE